ncbi:uncharacterized protein LOC133791130 [Humulus lupulus]|uniref:uncharacterized protein LOC133791130 n=1 Tax=Humulus lupulus TaxID=3486 RepID=UPI002B4175EB|nr:uncharacterized protein LOC133791130 [Humulus lupulus]
MEAEANAVNKFQTRLKAHAPPCLLLDQIISMAAVAAEPNFPANYSESDSCKAIPLLSPLILSPNTDDDDGDQEQLVNGKDTSIGGDDDDIYKGEDDKDDDQREDGVVADDDAVTPKNGWQNPAVPNFVDQSSLFSFFQSQCIIANQAPS